MHRERRDALGCDVVRGHVSHPPYVPYPRRARTPRRRLVTAQRRRGLTRAIRGKWPRQVALIHQPTHRLWRAIGRRSGARRRPCPGLSTCASGTGMTPPTPTDLPRAYKEAPTVPRAHARPPRATAVPPLAPPVYISLQSTLPLP
jgi:hypothetical protein